VIGDAGEDVGEQAWSDLRSGVPRALSEDRPYAARRAVAPPELGDGVRFVTFGRYLICYAERDGDRVVIERIARRQEPRGSVRKLTLRMAAGLPLGRRKRL
jgi:plasmid stabilization system protein ParE